MEIIKVYLKMKSKTILQVHSDEMFPYENIYLT